MNDILIKFKQLEYFLYVVDEKNTVSDLNSQTFFEKRINTGEFINIGSQMISLTKESYKFASNSPSPGIFLLHLNILSEIDVLH